MCKNPRPEPSTRILIVSATTAYTVGVDADILILRGFYRALAEPLGHSRVNYWETLRVVSRVGPKDQQSSLFD
jgi:hypothetical protein